jgi:GT2 family glycosyltransferase
LGRPDGRAAFSAHLAHNLNEPRIHLQAGALGPVAKRTGSPPRACPPSSVRLDRAKADMHTSPDPGVTILFATHNGAKTLPRMMAALERLRPPQRPWRIVGVDNASTDASAKILREAAARLPLTVLHAPTPGKAPSLVLGARAATGDLVVITDDDVEPCPLWLTAYEAAADRHRETGLFGGPITPSPMESVGPWFHHAGHHRAELFAHTEIDDGPVEPTANLFGPNFMLRREHLGLLETASVFGPTFADGRSAYFPMGDDTQLMALARERGIEARGVPDARVNHMVRAFQTELDFMLRRAVRHGRGWAIRYAGVEAPLLRRRLKLLVIGLAGSVTFAGRSSPEAAAFDRLWRAHWRRGVALGAIYGPFQRS